MEKTRKEYRILGLTLINNWKDISFPTGIDDWKKFERNNKDITLNILSVPSNTEKINLIYKSKHNRKRKNQAVLLMITDKDQEDTEEKWHYIALKSEPTDDRYKKPINSISALFRGITSSNNGDFYCLGCLRSYRTDNALKNMKDFVITMIIVTQICPPKIKTL